MLVGFRTANSCYEMQGDMIRRLEGVNDPTPRQGPDGEWKTFSSISEIAIGLPVVINWRYNEEKGVDECTITSAVTEIIASMEEHFE